MVGSLLMGYPAKIIPTSKNLSDLFLRLVAQFGRAKVLSLAENLSLRVGGKGYPGTLGRRFKSCQASIIGTKIFGLSLKDYPQRYITCPVCLKDAWAG